MDRQWRITLPDHLIVYGDLGESVVVAGIMEHIEIWASHKWNALKKGDEFRKLSQKVLKHYQI
jgi:DNA-binding transcriptional regulator/RsmH inhibitor MraZ